TFPKKYKASTLSQPKASQLVLQLQDLLEKEAIYLNYDLKIGDLATQLKVSIQHLSQTINQELDTNFRGLINQYRIQYSMQLMETKKGKWNLKEIAFQSGFNNKTTFATAFKKVNGSTPSQYLEQLKAK
ncbi:MAG: helix-turn-helix domain-containing protein, partial [Bacteroidota bacterium]